MSLDPVGFQANDGENLTPLQITQLRQTLEQLRDTIDRALEVFQRDPLAHREASGGGTHGAEQVVEGVFNGQHMVGADGHEYQIPPNYASKSKLVEGDLLKLTIEDDGTMLYKQIGPIERERVRATLEQEDDTRQWYAVAGRKRWRLITAAVTYYKGMAGEEVIVLIPQGGKSQWAAVEHVIKSGE